jgi:hypothetical protein
MDRTIGTTTSPQSASSASKQKPSASSSQPRLPERVHLPAPVPVTQLQEFAAMATQHADDEIDEHEIYHSLQ